MFFSTSVKAESMGLSFFGDSRSLQIQCCETSVNVFGHLYMVLGSSGRPCTASDEGRNACGLRSTGPARLAQLTCRKADFLLRVKVKVKRWALTTRQFPLVVHDEIY